MEGTAAAVMVAGIKADRRRVLVGSGIAVRSGKVLTARHCLTDAEGTAFQAIRVKHDGTFHDAEIAWSGLDDVDVAVLTVPTLDTPGCPILARATGAHEPAEVAGFPAIRDEAPNTAQRKLLVNLTSSAMGDDTLQVQLTADAPESVKGLSGAGVVANGRVIAVIKEVEPEWTAHLFATPIGRVFELPGFAHALGLADQAERLAELKAWLAARITEPLQRALDQSGESPEAIADALVERPAAALLRTLRDAAQGLTPDALADLKLIATRLVPYAVDLRPQVADTQATLRAQGWAELPVYSATVAELVIAGAHGCSASFEHHDGYVWRGATSLSAARLLQTLSPQPEGSRTAQELLKASVNELGTWFGFTSGATPEHEWAELVDVKLEELLREHGDSAPPYLIIDEQALWSDETRRAMLDPDEGLPNLRLVRLAKLSRAERRPERVIALLVDELLRQLEPEDAP